MDNITTLSAALHLVSANPAASAAILAGLFVWKLPEILRAAGKLRK